MHIQTLYQVARPDYNSVLSDQKNKELSLQDYRSEFYAGYHIAVGALGKMNRAHYDACARQARGRWARWLPPDRSAAILDLGCGCGEFLYFLRSQGYQNIIGVDVCEAEIEYAREAGISQAVCTDALDFLKDRKEEFEIISAFNFFEHLNKGEILELLKVVYQALKPEGRLLAVTPNGLSIFGGATRYWDFSHETGFTPASWRQLARVSGFSDAQFEEYGPMPHSLPGVVRAVLWQVVRLGLQMISFIEVGGPRDASKVYTADMKIILTK